MPTLEITTMVGCPMKCTFCPQDKLAANYPVDASRMLSYEDFRTILAKVPPHVRIDFSGMAEPWANRHATDMLAHALGMGHHVAIYTTLQGMRDAERVINLIHGYSHKIEAIVIHLPDSTGNMRGFKNTEQYRDALAMFHQLRHPRLQFMSMGESLVGGTDMPWEPHTRAGNLTMGGLEQPSHAVPVSCSFTPFYDQNVLLPNGDVMLCCMDYSLEHRLGNLLEQDYYEIFQSVGPLQANNMQYGCTGSICKKCTRARTHDLGVEKHFWTWSC